MSQTGLSKRRSTLPGPLRLLEAIPLRVWLPLPVLPPLMASLVLNGGDSLRILLALAGYGVAAVILCLWGWALDRAKFGGLISRFLMLLTLGYSVAIDLFAVIHGLSKGPRGLPAAREAINFWGGGVAIPVLLGLAGAFTAVVLAGRLKESFDDQQAEIDAEEGIWDDWSPEEPEPPAVSVYEFERHPAAGPAPAPARPGPPPFPDAPASGQPAPRPVPLTQAAVPVALNLRLWIPLPFAIMLVGTVVLYACQPAVAVKAATSMPLLVMLAAASAWGLAWGWLLDLSGYDRVGVRTTLVGGALVAGLGSGVSVLMGLISLVADNPEIVGHGLVWASVFAWLLLLVAYPLCAIVTAHALYLRYHRYQAREQRIIRRLDGDRPQQGWDRE